MNKEKLAEWLLWLNFLLLAWLLYRLAGNQLLLAYAYRSLARAHQEHMDTYHSELQEGTPDDNRPNTRDRTPADHPRHGSAEESRDFDVLENERSGRL